MFWNRETSISVCVYAKVNTCSTSSQIECKIDVDVCKLSDNWKTPILTNRIQSAIMMRGAVRISSFCSTFNPLTTIATTIWFRAEDAIYVVARFMTVSRNSPDSTNRALDKINSFVSPSAVRALMNSCAFAEFIIFGFLYFARERTHREMRVVSVSRRARSTSHYALRITVGAAGVPNNNNSSNRSPFYMRMPEQWALSVAIKIRIFTYRILSFSLSFAYIYRLRVCKVNPFIYYVFKSSFHLACHSEVASKRK